MSENVREAQRRIKQVRQKDIVFHIIKDGQPVEQAGVQVRMKNHQFLFGAICYKYGTYKDPEMNGQFTQAFTKLLNYTMIPYHWGEFEPRQHEYNEPYTGNLIRWAKSNNIKRKLHALIWHEVCPKWLTYEDDIKERYTERISHIMANYGANEHAEIRYQAGAFLQA